MDNNQLTSRKINEFGIILVKILTSGILLSITAFFTPDFQSSNIFLLLFTTIILSTLDYFIAKFTNLHFNPIGKGILGFILASVCLFILQYFIVGYTVSFISVIVGGLIYGVVDYLLPNNE